VDTLGENRPSRRAFAVAGLIAAVLVLVSCGPDGRSRHEVASADRADRAESGCARQLTVLFWPKGHPAIPSIDFPSLPMPHVEIYGGTDPSYPMSAALAWAFTHPPGPGFPPRSTKPECLSDLSTDDLPAWDAASALDDAARLVCHRQTGRRSSTKNQGRVATRSL
jgi:hypothetical protein